MEEQMQKSVWRGILRNHSLAMILCCAIPMTLLLILSLSGSLGSWGYYAIFLLCPLLHVLTMRGHRMTSDHIKAQASPADEATSPIPSPNLEKNLPVIKNEPSLDD
jgi:hypothetical protein